MPKTFTFRAQPALDLRQREFDASRRALATAEMEFHAAQQKYQESLRELADAHLGAQSAMARAVTVATIEWHRVWIARLERSRDALAAGVADRRAAVERAMAARDAARQRLEALERLKEKAREAWDEAARGQEQREADALATMRFVAASRELMARSAL